jgi:hypothetical protein
MRKMQRLQYLQIEAVALQCFLIKLHFLYQDKKWNKNWRGQDRKETIDQILDPRIKCGTGESGMTTDKI